MARRKKKFQAPDTPGRREYQIKQKSWKKYTESLKKLSDKASDELKKYLLEGHTEEETIDVAYALVTKYGEASSELACQMYEALAEYSGARVAAAEPAETATYGETARSIRGAMMRTRDAAAISSSAGRLVKLASVDTMMKNALRDGAEWAWIPQGDTCAFCIMLASRGWVKASEDALKNGHAEHIHNNCDCTYCVRFDHETTVEGYDPDALYEEYINAGDTKWERINALRRQHYAANRDKINAQKRAAYARKKASDADEKNRAEMIEESLTNGHNRRILDVQKNLSQEAIHASIPADFIDNFVDFNSLSIQKQDISVLIDLRTQTKQTGYEHGKAIHSGGATSIFTSNLKDRVNVPEEVMTFENVHLMHSHTNVTLFSGKDLRFLTFDNIERVSVVTGDGAVYSVTVGEGYKPSTDVYDEVVNSIRREVDIDLLDWPEFWDWSENERTYMAIREQAYRIARYFGWNLEGGRI